MNREQAEHIARAVKALAFVEANKGDGSDDTFAMEVKVFDGLVYALCSAPATGDEEAVGLLREWVIWNDCGAERGDDPPIKRTRKYLEARDAR